MSEAAIFTEGLSKSFGAQAAVSELSLKIQSGAVYGFLGRNGAGKTTTMRMLLGLVRPTKGSARVLGLDPTREAELLRILERVAFVPQRKQLYGWATPAELVRMNKAYFPRWSDDADRKSTRLNSSHSQISYAVFCLKKKKNKRYILTMKHTVQSKWTS